MAPVSLVLSTTHIMDEIIIATDFTRSSSIVQNPNTVKYFAGICIELTPGFETLTASNFIAAIANFCN